MKAEHSLTLRLPGDLHDAALKAAKKSGEALAVWIRAAMREKLGR